MRNLLLDLLLANLIVLIFRYTLGDNALWATLAFMLFCQFRGGKP